MSQKKIFKYLPLDRITLVGFIAGLPFLVLGTLLLLGAIWVFSFGGEFSSEESGIDLRGIEFVIPIEPEDLDGFSDELKE